MNSWEKLKNWIELKIFGEPLSDDELEDLNDTIINISDKDRKKLVKKNEEKFDKSHWKYSLGWIIIYLGVWGLSIWKGLRNGETLYEIMFNEERVMLYVFGVMLIGFVFFKVKNPKYEDGMN